MRHHDIENRRRKVGVVLKRFVRFAPVAGTHNRGAFLLQNSRHQTQNRRIVVGNQDASFGDVIGCTHLICRMTLFSSGYAASRARPLSPAFSESSAAILIAATMLECSAIPFPAMSKAVP